MGFGVFVRSSCPVPSGFISQRSASPGPDREKTIFPGDPTGKLAWAEAAANKAMAIVIPIRRDVLPVIAPSLDRNGIQEKKK